jgi:hypothetical protein
MSISNIPLEKAKVMDIMRKLSTTVIAKVSTYSGMLPNFDFALFDFSPLNMRINIISPNQ